ncbi:MAG: helix-turn-helix transcriptional regulator [Pseudomonadota bacterium]
MTKSAQKTEVTSIIGQIVTARSVSDAWEVVYQSLPQYGLTQIFYSGTCLPTQGYAGSVDETIVLMHGPPDYTEIVLGEKLYLHGVMFSWAAKNRGFVSFPDAIRSHGQALTPKLMRLWEINAKFGFISGYMGGLNAIVPGMRGVIGLGAPAGFDQLSLDGVWQRHGKTIEMICNTFHLRLASLPQTGLLRPLTSRQLEVLKWCADGKITQDIADIMGISIATVEKHMRMARDALEAQTTAHAIRKATSLNLLTA